MTITTRRMFTTALAATACATTLFGTSFAQDKQKTFALIQVNQQALYFNLMNSAAQKAADAAGVKLVIFDANNEPAAQNSAIETYIQQKVDGIGVISIDVNGIMPAVQQAADAHIPILGVDNVLPEGPQNVQIAIDNAKAGADIGKFFLDYAKKNFDGKVKYGVVGSPASIVQNLRLKGFEDTVKNVEGVTTVGVVDGENVQDAALAAAENLITGNPDMNAIYATGEPALIGAIAAVQSQGKQSQIAVFGWDLSVQAISGIDGGFVKAVVQQDPAAEGKITVETLKKITDGQPVEKKIIVPTTIVTSDNVGPYREIYK